MSNNIINWDNIFEKSEEFKNNEPFRFTYIEQVFEQDFYDKLYESFPKFNEDWFVNNDYRRTAKTKYFYEENEGEPKEDASLSPEWNELKKYINTQEFIKNFAKFSGLDLKKTVRSGFFANSKGDFQLPHIDEEGEFTNQLQIMFYFAKGWQKNDPGGTYICENDDESSIIFEPWNLDNTMVCFEETLHSWHGTRYITKDVVRQACSASIL